MQKLMYRVVSLMIASIFYFSAWNAALMARLLDGTGTPEKIASLMMAAFLVLWMMWVFEGHAERELARRRKDSRQKKGRRPRRQKK